MFDLVVRNGTVIDGSGAPGRRADVGVTDGRIAAVGAVDGRGAREIDAEGQVVTPGFVDGHTHFDAQVMWDPLGTSSCWHGVTTAVMGNCGFTLAPARRDARALVVRNLERAEDMSPAALAAGIDWTWEHFREYLDAVDRRPKGLNYAAYVGHSALRTWAMGERAFEEAATDDDLAVMEAELRDALAAGAIGFTTSRSDQHATSDDRPVASRLADWVEVCRLVGITGAVGRTFELTSEPRGSSPDADVRRGWYDQLQQLALTSGAATTFGLPAAVAPRCYEVLDLFERTAAAGGRMFGQTHCRGVSVVLSFRTRLPFDTLAGWRDVRALPEVEQITALRDPDVRQRLVFEAEHGEYPAAIGAEARKPNFAQLVVLDEPVPPHRTVAELAAARRVSPVELMIDLTLERGFDQLFLQPLTPSPDDDLVRVLRHPWTAMTFSDSGAHMSQIADSSIHTYLFAHWVRGREALTLEEAVRMVSHAPASLWGFTDRGLVAEGMVADLNVFDPDTIGPRLPQVVDDLPAGARRLVQRSDGFAATIVAGEPVIVDGEHTGALPGRLLRF